MENIIRSLCEINLPLQQLGRSGITANEDWCRELVSNSIGIITAITPTIGYENATCIAGLALDTGRSVLDLVREENLLDEATLVELMSPENG